MNPGINSRELVTQLIYDAAYSAVQHSELWDRLSSNGDIDAKADELAAKIRSLVDNWLIENEAAEVMRSRGSECGASVESEEVEEVV